MWLANVVLPNNMQDLQNLYDNYKEKGLVVIGVPSNQFGSQEPGSNDEIKDFCETNFGINFPMTSKYNVKGLTLIRFIYGLKKILEIQQFLNGIFIKF